MYLIKTDYSKFEPSQSESAVTQYVVREVDEAEAENLMQEWGRAWKRQMSQLAKETRAFVLNECFSAKDKTGEEFFWIPLDADGFVGPFFRHYGLYGNLKVPLPEALLTRQENELPIIYKKKLDGWIAFLESDAPRAESPMREDDTTLKLVKDERVVEENRQPDRAR